MARDNAQAAKAQAAAERTPAKQEQRAALLAKLKANGVFNRIENRGGGLVRVWTGRAFDGLDVQTKESFCGVGLCVLLPRAVV